MKSYRILHVAQWLKIGGAEKVLFDLVSNLDKIKFESIVCAFKGGGIQHNYAAAGINHKILIKNPGLDCSLVLRLFKLTLNCKVNLLHCHGVPPTVYGGLITAVLRLPLVITVHGRSAFSAKSGVKALQYAEKCGARIVAVTEQLKSELCLNVGLKETSVATIWNGINVEEYNKAHSNMIDLQRTDLGFHGGPILGCVGSLREAKGHRYLIVALPEIVKKYPNVKLVIVGDGHLRNNLLHLAKTLDLEDHLLFLGQRLDVPRLMSLFDVIVQPSLTEGLSIVILEAMASSKPVIATKVGGNPTIIETGKTGLLVEPANPRELAKAVLYLLDNPETRIRIGKQGNAKVRNQFSISKTCARYEQLYLATLNK